MVKAKTIKKPNDHFFTAKMLKTEQNIVLQKQLIVVRVGCITLKLIVPHKE